MNEQLTNIINTDCKLWTPAEMDMMEKACTKIVEAEYECRVRKEMARECLAILHEEARLRVERICRYAMAEELGLAAMGITLEPA